MSMPAWMPGAVHLPISYRHDAGAFGRTPLGWVLHVVVGNGSPYRGFAFAQPGNRRFSHFWVSKTGHIEQYAETYLKSWAQLNGNSDYWSVETEGYPTEALTAAQIQSLAKVHNFLGTADAIASKPGQKGIGTHYMGGAAWGGHTCPDPVPGKGPRSRQRAAIIAASRPVPPPPKPKPATGGLVEMFACHVNGESAIWRAWGDRREWLADWDDYKLLYTQGVLSASPVVFPDRAALDRLAGLPIPGTPLPPGY